MATQRSTSEIDSDDSIASSMNDEGIFAAGLRTCREMMARFPLTGPVKALRAPVLALARTARQERVAPERFVAELKSVLFQLPHFEARRALERGEMMHQLVSVGIDAYYGRASD